MDEPIRNGICLVRYLTKNNEAELKDCYDALKCTRKEAFDGIVSLMKYFPEIVSAYGQIGCGSWHVGRIADFLNKFGTGAYDDLFERSKLMTLNERLGYFASLMSVMRAGGVWVDSVARPGCQINYPDFYDYRAPLERVKALLKDRNWKYEDEDEFLHKWEAKLHSREDHIKEHNVPINPEEYKNLSVKDAVRAYLSHIRGPEVYRVVLGKELRTEIAVELTDQLRELDASKRRAVIDALKKSTDKPYKRLGKKLADEYS